MEKTQTTITPQQPTLRFKTYPKNERVADYNAKLVKLITKTPRFIHKMDLNYSYVSFYCEPIETENLHAPLEKLKLIKSLHISFFEANFENCMVLQNISMKLKSLYFLQELSLQFCYGGSVSLEGVRHLANALAQLKSLKKLVLNLEPAEWATDESFHFIFRSLRKNINLQEFELDLCNCFNVTEKSFKELVSVFKHSLKSLKELSLDLAGLDFTNSRSLDFLAYGLNSFKDLQKLKINFSNLQVSQEMDFSSFMLAIKDVNSLQSLNLNFANVPISVTELKDLAKSFTSLPHLHTLSLNFQNSPTFAGSEMEALAQCLQTRAPSLKNLTLDFNYSQNVNNEALEKLSVGLRTLTNLSAIRLQCAYWRSIGENGIASVIYGLVSLNNLHSLILDFRGCGPHKKTLYENLKAKNFVNFTFAYDNSNE